MQAKHSLEGVCARTADAFTTVSEITAAEGEYFKANVRAPTLTLRTIAPTLEYYSTESLCCTD